MIFFFHIQSNHLKYINLLIYTAELSQLYIMTRAQLFKANDIVS